MLDEVDCRALIDTTWSAKDAMSKYAKVLNVFVEEDDDAFFLCDVGGDEDG